MKKVSGTRGTEEAENMVAVQETLNVSKKFNSRYGLKLQRNKVIIKRVLN